MSDENCEANAPNPSAGMTRIRFNGLAPRHLSALDRAPRKSSGKLSPNVTRSKSPVKTDASCSKLR